MTAAPRRSVVALGLGVWLLAGAATIGWLSALEPDQDLHIYREAVDRAAANLSPYLPIAIGDAHSYTYHPAQLLIVGALVPHTVGFSWIWFGECLGAWIASLWLARECVRVGLDMPHRPPAWWLVAAAMSYGPLLETLYLGQINTLVTLAMLLSLWLLLRGSQWAAGAALAVAIVLKASPVLALGYLAAARKWVALAAAVAGVALLTLLPAIVFSPRLPSEYWQVVSAIGGGLPPVDYNQSPLSVLYRATRQYLPQAVGLVRHLAAPLAVALSAAVLWPLAFRVPTRPLLTSSFAAIWLVAMLTSPLVWYHHGVFLIAAVAIALSSEDAIVRTLAAAGACAVQAQRALELAGGSRWLAAVVGEAAIAVALGVCLWRMAGSGPRTRTVWIAPSRA